MVLVMCVGFLNWLKSSMCIGTEVTCLALIWDVHDQSQPVTILTKFS